MNALMFRFERFKENKVVRNSIYGIIQFIVPAILLLVFTPIFIRQMGTERYGLWMLAISALGLMSIAEFGLNTAIAKFVAEFVENRNTETLSVIVSVGLVAYILLGLGIVGPLYVFSPALAGIFKPSQTVSVEQISLVLQIVSLGFIPLLLRSGAMAIPIGLQQFRVPVLVTIGYQILSYTAALMVVFLGGSVAQVVKSTVVVLWITALGSLFVAWRMLKPFNLKFTISRSGQVLYRMFSFSLMSGISGLGSQIFGFADRLIVGAVLGLNALAYYIVIISVANKILQLSGSLTSTLMPAVSTWMASGDIQRVRAYFLRATAALLVLNFLVASVLLLLSGPLLRLWMGEAFANHVLFPFRVLIVIYALISLNAPAHHVANGMGIPWLNAIGSMVGGFLTISLILPLGKTFGLLGVAIANSGYLFIFVLIVFVNIYLHGYSAERLQGSENHAQK